MYCSFRIPLESIPVGIKIERRTSKGFRQKTIGFCTDSLRSKVRCSTPGNPRIAEGADSGWDGGSVLDAGLGPRIDRNPAYGGQFPHPLLDIGFHSIAHQVT